MTFIDILNDIRKKAYSEQDKGQRFERLMRSYLLTDPLYANTLESVWLWADFPFRNDFSGKDTGIDLVARTTAGDFWAIQCKCYAADAHIDKAGVDTFLSTSGKQFQNENFEKVSFAHRLWIATTNNRKGLTCDYVARNIMADAPGIRLPQCEAAMRSA